MRPDIRISTNFQSFAEGPASAPVQFNPSYFNFDHTDMQQYPMSASINPIPNCLSSERSDKHGQFIQSIQAQQQLINESNLPRKKRYKPTPEQVVFLMDAFGRDPLPSTAVRLELATRIDMRPRAIQSNLSIVSIFMSVWFQNKRAKVKSLEKDKRNILEFGASRGENLHNRPQITFQTKPLIYPHQQMYPTYPSKFIQQPNQQINASKPLNNSLQNQPATNPRNEPAVFIKPLSNQQLLPSAIPSPIASPLNSLIQLQEFQNSLQTNWLSNPEIQNVSMNHLQNFDASSSMQIPSLMMQNNMVDYDLIGYSADDLLRFLEM